MLLLALMVWVVLTVVCAYGVLMKGPDDRDPYTPIFVVATLVLVAVQVGG